MSALGQKRTLKRLNPMSALPPIADIRIASKMLTAIRHASPFVGEQFRICCNSPGSFGYAAQSSGFLPCFRLMLRSDFATHRGLFAVRFYLCDRRRGTGRLGLWHCSAVLPAQLRAKKFTRRRPSAFRFSTPQSLPATPPPGYASLPPEDQAEQGSGQGVVAALPSSDRFRFSTTEPAGADHYRYAEHLPLSEVLGNGRAIRYGVGVGREGSIGRAPSVSAA